MVSFFFQRLRGASRLAESWVQQVDVTWALRYQKFPGFSVHD